MRTESPAISVIVPVFNAERTLTTMLDALVNQQTLDRKAYEVIVVDNGSTDGSPRIAQSYEVVWHQELSPGPAAARNKGIVHAAAPLIAFADSDCVPFPDWLESLLRSYETSGADVIGGHVEPYKKDTLVEKFIAACQNELLFPQEQAVTGMRHPFKYVITANAAVRKSALEAVQMFDERFQYAVGEDADLGRRLCEAGYAFHYDATVRVRHWNVDSLVGLYRHFFKRGYYNVLNPYPPGHQGPEEALSLWKMIQAAARHSLDMALGVVLFPFDEPTGRRFFEAVLRFGFGMGGYRARRSGK